MWLHRENLVHLHPASFVKFKLGDDDKAEQPDRKNALAVRRSDVRDILFALASVLIFVLVRPGLAQNQDTAASLVLACDLAAASPSDTQRPVGIAGVPKSKFDPQVAIAAC